MPDMPMAAFIAHIAAFETRLHHHKHAALEHAALIVEKEAKHELGNYQEAAGPFAAWAELADRTKEDRIKKGFTENDPGRRTGEMADGIGHAVGDGEAVVGSNDDKAVWFELGTAKQPPRSFLGGAAFRKEKEIGHALGQSVVSALIGKEVHGGRLAISGP